MKTKEDFLLDVRAAVKRNQVVIMMLQNTETGEFAEYSNGYGIDFDEMLSDFLKMPFLSHISVSQAFEEWKDYFENLYKAEIYGFELDDGVVQMAILDYYIKEPKTPKSTPQTLFSRTFCYFNTLFSRTFCRLNTLFSRTFGFFYPNSTFFLQHFTLFTIFAICN